MKQLTITLKGTRIGCPPLKCGKGAPIAMELREASANKSADGAGWLVGVIAEAPRALCQIGLSDWVYVINFPDSEFSAEFLEDLLGELEGGDMNTGDGAVGLCCLDCGILMILDRLLAPSVLNAKRESFRLHADDEPIVVGSTRLFRMHSPLLISAIEISCEEHLEGAYDEEPQKVKVSLLSSPGQVKGPATELSPLEAIIDPASAKPLTARRVFVPPLELPSGAALFANTDSIDPEAHLGLEIHVDFQIQDEE